MEGSEKNREHLEQFLANIRRNAQEAEKRPGVQELRGVFGGRAAVIIGAGPSLARTAPLLAGDDRVITFACDRARDAAVRAGVRPTFTVTTDPKAATASFITEPGVEIETLLAATYCAPEILALPWGGVYFYNSLDSDRAFNEEARRLCPGPEFLLGGLIVSNFAFLAASLMGCDPITFIGNDMCAPEPEPGWMESENYIHMELSNGTKVHTLKSFLLSLDWLDNYLETVKRTGHCPETFNSSGGGIFYSPNIRPKSLEDFLSDVR